MVRASLTLSIRAIHPSAVYESTVYTQDAVVSLTDGREFEIYDPKMTLSEKHAGTVQSIELFVFSYVMQPLKGKTKEIVFDKEKQPVFRGQVTDVRQENKRDFGILDIGIGTILFYPDETDSTVKRGDWFQLSRTARQLRNLY